MCKDPGCNDAQKSDTAGISALVSHSWNYPLFEARRRCGAMSGAGAVLRELHLTKPFSYVALALARSSRASIQLVSDLTQKQRHDEYQADDRKLEQPPGAVVATQRDRVAEGVGEYLGDRDR